MHPASSPALHCGKVAAISKKKEAWYINSYRQGDLKFDIVLIIIMAILALIFFYPMYLVFISSFSSPNEVYTGNVLLLPKGSNYKGFQQVLETKELWSGYVNSAIYTVVGTIINLFCTMTGAFVLSRPNFALRKPITLMIVVTMFFGGGMIPTYLLVKDLKMLNTIWALVLPGAVSTWNLMVTRTFLQSSIPEELHESAAIDGCNNIQYFLRIILPLSSTIIAVIGMFYAVGHWNAYFNAMLYITKKEMYPLQLVLRNLLLNAEYALSAAKAGEVFDDYNMEKMMEMYQLAESMKYIIVLATVLPIIVVFPFVEKYFVKGVMVGSLKG